MLIFPCKSLYVNMSTVLVIIIGGLVLGYGNILSEN